MKIYILVFTYFILMNSYSQSKSYIYFFINKKDTLIKKQIATKTNKYEGYRVINEKRLVKATKKSSNIDGDDIEYDTFESFSFSFNRKNESIISKSYIKNLNIIKDREQFLDTIKNLSKDWIDLIFIESKNCNEYIMRKVEILTF